jgi:hypothetical protein
MNFSEIDGTSGISSTGYINTTASQFNPDCSFSIGPQNWTAGILNSNVHFKPSNSSYYKINITTVPLSINIIQQGMEPLKKDAININFSAILFFITKVSSVTWKMVYK